jgi:hypothetical protein
VNESNDRRSNQRRRTILKGRVLFNNRSSVFDCTIQNISDSGAQLSFADISLLPPIFELEIPSQDRRIQARVVWWRGKIYGVRFS